MPDFSEKAYLAELIKDFQTNKKIDVESAWQGIQTRYRVLDVNKENFVEIVLSEERPFNDLFYDIAKSIHEFLFDEVLSNAGEFRKITDADQGAVRFGPQDLRSPWGRKFKGTHPNKIEPELRATFSFLTKTDPNPLRTSILFYQKFVRIHPFYDANGRIARFLITLYLMHHGLYVRWKKLEESKRNEFLQKLNACHLREGKSSFEEYFKYLFEFWRRYVVSKTELTKE